ncbi:hypothetical protein FRC04_001472 [Tulasnella sp. 424]|nr:hypothetical protein FRC04_001472 [Tulasnella sp. 424]KAG8974530.1 hypothetical protein FRC05_007162 [Tulasnella sp. 425]
MQDEAPSEPSGLASGSGFPFGNAETPLSPRASVYSYASSIDKHFVIRELYGRMVNNTNEHYVIPADGEEHGREAVLHEMLKVAMGGLYIRQAAPAVYRALTPRRDGDFNTVLDIGCGGGSWVIDMAQLYPHAEVVGMDLTPPNLLSSAPENTRFECDDANYGLSQYGAESVDVVHIRGLSVGIKDYYNLLKEAYAILRPAGVLLTVDCDLLAYDENRQPLTSVNEDEPGFLWMNRLLVNAYQGLIKCNPSADAYRHTLTWLKEMGENGNSWEECGELAVWVPLGPWTEELQGERVDGRESLAAQLLQLAFWKIGVALRPVLLTSGHPEEIVDRWIQEQEAEVGEMKAKLYFKWICTWAVKKGG